jgi:hypothetical protein
MGTPKEPKPVQFFASVIFSGTQEPFRAEQELIGLIGTIEEKTPPASFSYTKYYEAEMGDNLLRLFLLFEPLLQRERLAEIKVKTNGFERDLSTGGRRTVNIDAGYISLENVILATTKGYAHRIYLGYGIYADLTLVFTDGTYRGLEWTYPDYGTQGYISMFNRWRDGYRQKLKKMRNG